MTSKIFKTLYLLSIVAILVSFFNIKNLPDKTYLVDAMRNEPIQATTTVLKDFGFNYKDQKVFVQPIADYELWGLVVSVNNINAWYNMYHDKNSVNLKDICVIWGENLSTNAYKEVTYKSGEWTCYTRWTSMLSGPFHGNKLSNNHLFSDKPQVRDTINKMNIGDQIYIKGTLSKYSKNGGLYYRGTSLNRDDTGNGACETIYVSDAEILKKRSVDWVNIYKYSKIVFICLILLNIIIVFRDARRNINNMKKLNGK